MENEECLQKECPMVICRRDDCVHNIERECKAHENSEGVITTIIDTDLKCVTYEQKLYLRPRVKPRLKGAVND